jgi:hypothetical protein
MLKLVSLTLGLLTLVSIVPSSPAATFQTRPELHQIDGKLHVQKLAPIKKSSSLRTTVMFKTPVTTPSNQKGDLSTESKENQRVKTACQKEIESRQPFGSNERPLAVNQNPNKSNNFSGFGNFGNSTYTGNCNFTGKF